MALKSRTLNFEQPFHVLSILANLPLLGGSKYAVLFMAPPAGRFGYTCFLVKRSHKRRLISRIAALHRHLAGSDDFSPLIWFHRLLPENQGHNQALTVLFVPNSLNTGWCPTPEPRSSFFILKANGTRCVGI